MLKMCKHSSTHYVEYTSSQRRIDSFQKKSSSPAVNRAKETQSHNIPTSCCNTGLPTSQRCRQKQRKATERGTSIERMNDGQDRAPEPQRGKSSSQHSAAAEPLCGPGSHSPAQHPLSRATRLQGQVHRSSRGAQLPRTEEWSLSAAARDNSEG